MKYTLPTLTLGVLLLGSMGFGEGRDKYAGLFLNDRVRVELKELVGHDAVVLERK